MFRRISLLKPNNYGEISLLLVLSGGYLFGVFYLNLWSDDYAALSDNQSNSFHMLKDARPVSALLLFITFELVKFNLLFVIVFKFLSFLGLLFLARFLAGNLQNDMDRKWIVFLTIAIGLSPLISSADTLVAHVAHPLAFYLEFVLVQGLVQAK